MVTVVIRTKSPAVRRRSRAGFFGRFAQRFYHARMHHLVQQINGRRRDLTGAAAS